MRKLSVVLLAGVASFGLAGGALAADPIVIVPAPQPVVVEAPTVTSLAAYIEMFGALSFELERGDDTEIDEGDRERYRGLGAQARVSVPLGAALRLQADGWFEHWRELTDEEDFDDYRSGVAAHLIVTTGGGLMLGAMISTGHSSNVGEGAYTPAIEIAYMAERFRLGAQAGIAIGTGEYGEEYEPRDRYVQVVGTFYLNDNLAISANGGFSHYRELNDANYDFTEINWGTRVEFNPNGGSLGIFAAYQGTRETWIDGDIDTAHFVGIGLSLNNNGFSIRERDEAVGFTDLNPLYGPTFRR